MHLPKSWSNISVSQYAELKGLDASSFDSVFDYNLEMLSIITDTDINEIEDLDFDEMTAILLQLNWINREPNKPINRNISDLHYI